MKRARRRTIGELESGDKGKDGGDESDDILLGREEATPAVNGGMEGRQQSQSRASSSTHV